MLLADLLWSRRLVHFVRLCFGRETNSIPLQLKEMYQLNTYQLKMLNRPFNACWYNARLYMVSQLPRSFLSYLHSSMWAFHTCFTHPFSSTHGRARQYLWLPATHLVQPPKPTRGVSAFQRDVICIKQTDWSQAPSGYTCHTLWRHFQNKPRYKNWVYNEFNLRLIFTFLREQWT